MPALLDWLVSRYPSAKRQTLREMLEQGRVLVNGIAARTLKQAITDSDKVQVTRRVERPRNSIAPLRIIHEDQDILVVFKPAGLLTSTVARERRPTAIALVRAYLADHDAKARAGVIHRLDRDASGLLVFSKCNEAYASLKRQFFEHSVERVYVALVHGRPEQAMGRIKSRLIGLPDGKVVSTTNPEKGQLAISDYELLASDGKMSVLRVSLRTGRKHQIRAHLTERGWPIVGDDTYGMRDTGRLLLSAVRLAIAHPRTGQRMQFEIPPPREMVERMAKWKGGSTGVAT